MFFIVFRESQKKEKMQSVNNSMYVKRTELDRIVEEETKKRQSSIYQH